MQIIFISSLFRACQLHWLHRNYKLGMVFHTGSLMDASFAQKKLLDRLGRSVCKRHCWCNLRWHFLCCCFISVFNNSFSLSCGSISVNLHSMVNLLWFLQCFITNRSGGKLKKTHLARLILNLALVELSFVLPSLSSCVWMTKSSFCTWRHKGGSRDRDGIQECCYPGDGLGDGRKVEEGIREDRGRRKEGSWKEQLKLESTYFLHLQFFLGFCCPWSE